ncbi:hypothetical protein BC829DRAFT_404521, partial [Chytridium lagenaria]
MCIVIVSVIGIAVAVYIFRKWLLPTSNDFKRRRLGLDGTVRRPSGAPGHDDDWSPTAPIGAPASSVGAPMNDYSNDASAVMGTGRSSPDRHMLREHINSSSPLPGGPTAQDLAQQQPTLPDLSNPNGSVVSSQTHYDPYAMYHPYAAQQGYPQQAYQPQPQPGYPMQWGGARFLRPQVGCTRLNSRSRSSGCNLVIS